MVSEQCLQGCSISFLYLDLPSQLSPSYNLQLHTYSDSVLFASRFIALDSVAAWDNGMFTWDNGMFTSSKVLNIIPWADNEHN